MIEAYVLLLEVSKVGCLSNDCCDDFPVSKATFEDLLIKSLEGDGIQFRIFDTESFGIHLVGEGVVVVEVSRRLVLVRGMYGR